MPNLSGPAGDYGSQEEQQNTDHDDFSGPELVGGYATEWGHGSANQATEGICQGDGHWAPTHVLLKRDYQRAEGLANRPSCHMHGGRDGNYDPGVVDAGKEPGNAALLLV